MIQLFDFTQKNKTWHTIVTNGTCWQKNIFVYDIPQIWVNDTIIQFVHLFERSREYDSCLSTSNCKMSFGPLDNAWTYTGELLIMARFLSQCNIVKRASEADFFVVPFPFAMWQVAGWHTRRHFPNIVADMKKYLIHLNDKTASRHVFFDTNDSRFIVVNDLSPLVIHSTVVHLGDDKWISHGLNRKQYFSRSVVVPYRTSTIKETFSSKRNILLFGAINTKRHAVRKKILQVFENMTEKGVIVKEMNTFKNLQNTGLMMTNSKYCICPSGDAPSFTQRFYSSVLKGCLPIRVDPYDRLPVSPYRYPFDWLIDWKTFGITYKSSEIHKILPDLYNLEEKGFSDKFRRHISNRVNSLSYDISNDMDASQTALQEIVTYRE